MNKTPEPDPFTTYDAAYVLGTLSPGERAAFEAHVHGCGRCAHAVRELAGIPGLLAQVEPEQLDPEMFGAGSPPPTLLPNLLRRVRRERRRRVVTTVASAAAAVAACVALLLVLVMPRGGPGPPGAEMTPMGSYPVQAHVGLVDTAGGTRVEMSCTYHGGWGREYELVAVRRDGGTSELASWYAVPRGTADLAVGTPLRRADIAALQVRVPDGPVVLRMPVSG